MGGTVPVDNVFNITSFSYYDITELNVFPMVNSLYYQKMTVTEDNNQCKIAFRWSPGQTSANIIVANESSGKNADCVVYEIKTLYDDIYQYQSHPLSSSYTYDNKTVYYTIIDTGITSRESHDYGVITIADKSFIPANEGTVGQIAWLMIYGGYEGFPITYDLEGCTGDEDNPRVVPPPPQSVTNLWFYPDEGYAFSASSVWIEGDGFPSGTPIIYVFDHETGHLRIGPCTSEITIHVSCFNDPYSHVDGESEIAGGGSISLPSLPALSATSAGVVGLFAPTVLQMQLLAGYMWTDFGGTGTTEVDVLGEIVQALKRLISNPLDYIMGLSIIPSQGLSIGSLHEIRFGFTNSGVSMPRIANQYFIVDCGTLSFDALCGDTFLDYAPYSKFSLYLPYIGIKEMDANDFVGHTIGVIYHGDIVTGGLTAYVTKDGSVMYQYSGCCALNIPLSADSWGGTIAGAVNVATSMIAGGMAGGAAGVAAAAAKGAANVAANPSLLSPTVQRSGAISGGAGCMGIQTPFVIREAVRFHSTENFNKISGYPAYYYKRLSNVTGLTTVVNVHLEGIPATEEEITEIESLLKEGVIF